jgi:hypothetical protein
MNKIEIVTSVRFSFQMKNEFVIQNNIYIDYTSAVSSNIIDL